MRRVVGTTRRGDEWSAQGAQAVVREAIHHIRKLPQVRRARLRAHQRRQRRQQDEVDSSLDQLLEEVEASDASSDEMPGLDGDSVSDEGSTYLGALETMNQAMDVLHEESACVLRGIDSKAELYPLSAPSRLGETPRILAGGQSRLLLYSAVATASVWDGRDLKAAPIIHTSADKQKRWEQEFQEMSPRQRRRMASQRRSTSTTRLTSAVRVMVDSGASRNFISQRLVKEKWLRTHQAPAPLEVTVADGERLTTDRMVTLTLDFQGYTYTQPMYVLPLGISASVILGVPFLEDISPFWCDLRRDARTISFRHHGREIKLTPSPEAMPGAPVISLKKALLEMRIGKRLLKSTGSDAALAYLCVLLPTKEDQGEVPYTEEASLDSVMEDTRPPAEPPPKGISPNPSALAQATQQAVNRLQRGFAAAPWTAASTSESKRVGDSLSDLIQWDGKGPIPKSGIQLIHDLTTMGKANHTLGDSFWDVDKRQLLSKLVASEFADNLKEELPLRDGPDVDYSKAPATIRFKDSYAGETPHRPGIKMSPMEIHQCREILLDLLKNGYIRPSSSPFGAPILMVPKPGQPGKLRMVVDYRALNALTQADRFPLPTIDGLLQQMSGSKVFSTLDMLSGFWQMPLLEEHKERTAMTTTLFGSFEWNVLPMGCKNAPSIFQRNMSELLREFDFVSCYIDDIIIHSKTTEEHVQHVRAVMQRLREGNMYVKNSKAKLFRTSVNFLGHLLSADGVAPQTQKIEAVAQWPAPKNVTEVRSFLGLASFYRKFVSQFAAIATPLHRLTRADEPWQWRMDHEDKAFRMLKEALTTAPLLVLPDVEAAMSGRAPYLVQVDASLMAWGAVLMQDQGLGYQPIAFVSKSFNDAQVNYSATERELQALVSCTCKEFRHFLWGMDYRLQGDHRPLTWLLDPRRELSRRQARWITELMENNVPAMTWVPGKQLVVPDALSRRPDLMDRVVPPQAGIRMEVGDHTVQTKCEYDPADSLRPTDPLRDGYRLPHELFPVH